MKKKALVVIILVVLILVFVGIIFLFKNEDKEPTTNEGYLNKEIDKIIVYKIETKNENLDYTVDEDTLLEGKELGHILDKDVDVVLFKEIIANAEKIKKFVYEDDTMDSLLPYNPNYVMEMYNKEEMSLVYLWLFDLENAYVSYEENGEKNHFKVTVDDTIKLKEILFDDYSE